MAKFIRGIVAKLLEPKEAVFLSILLILGLAKCLSVFLCLNALSDPGKKIGYFPDSRIYEQIADNLLSGRGFSQSESVPFKATMFKEPLYPFFIAAVKYIFGNNINFVFLIQALLNPLLAVLVYFIGKEIFTERIARLASFLVALIPVYAEISFFIMPEIIFVLLLMITILCLIKGDKHPGYRWFILSGLLLGFSSLCRNSAFLLFLLYPVTILIQKRKNIRRPALILKLILFILSFCIVTLPWMYRNQQKLGMFSISRRGIELLAHQANWAANFSNKEWRAYSLYIVSGNLAQRFYPSIIGNDFGEYEYRILMRTGYIDDLMAKYGESETERILALEAIKNILKHPFRFLFLSTIVYMQAFKYFVSVFLMLLKWRACLTWIISLIRFGLFIMGIVYALLALRGMLLSRKIFKAHIMLITIIYFHIMLTIVGIIPGGLQRHILPITVLYSFFVVIVIDKRNARTFS